MNPTEELRVIAGRFAWTITRPGTNYADLLAWIERYGPLLDDLDTIAAFYDPRDVDSTMANVATLLGKYRAAMKEKP